METPELSAGALPPTCSLGPRGRKERRVCGAGERLLGAARRWKSQPLAQAGLPPRSASPACYFFQGWDIISACSSGAAAHRHATFSFLRNMTNLQAIKHAQGKRGGGEANYFIFFLSLGRKIMIKKKNTFRRLFAVAESRINSRSDVWPGMRWPWVLPARMLAAMEGTFLPASSLPLWGMTTAGTKEALICSPPRLSPFSTAGFLKLISSPALLRGRTRPPGPQAAPL